VLCGNLVSTLFVILTILEKLLLIAPSLICQVLLCLILLVGMNLFLKVG